MCVRACARACAGTSACVRGIQYHIYLLLCFYFIDFMSTLFGDCKAWIPRYRTDHRMTRHSLFSPTTGHHQVSVCVSSLIASPFLNKLTGFCSPNNSVSHRLGSRRLTKRVARWFCSPNNSVSHRLGSRKLTKRVARWYTFSLQAWAAWSLIQFPAPKEQTFYSIRQS